MKRLTLLLFIAAALAASTADDANGQQRRRPGRSSAPGLPGDSTYFYKGRNRGYMPGKTINESTIGVLGQDTIKMNPKGQHRNLNANTGQPLPPNTGRIQAQ